MFSALELGMAAHIEICSVVTEGTSKQDEQELARRGLYRPGGGHAWYIAFLGNHSNHLIIVEPDVEAKISRSAYYHQSTALLTT